MKNIPYVDVDYCQFSDWGYKKPTRIWGCQKIAELAPKLCDPNTCTNLVMFKNGRGQSATLRLGPKTVLARFGMLHPALLKQFDIGVPVAAVELFLDAIPAKKSSGFARAAYAPPALQAVKRDFAFLVDAQLAAGDLVRTVKGADKANIVAVRLFDDFRGAGVPEGKKSLAVEVTLQPGEKSYDEAELKAIAERVTAAAVKLGAVLRG